jgi:CSLREA domain-containing protein
VAIAAAAAALFALGVPGSAAPQFGNIVVDTTADGNDGECNNDCTLREAIAIADSGAGQFVTMRPGVYRLTQGPITLGNDVVFGVSFAGNFSFGARTTIIDARGNSRVFDVPAGVSAVVAGVTITGGRADTGGAAFVANGGQLSLYDTIVKGNAATGRGGAIANAGNFAVAGSTLSGNSAAAGGAIASEINTNTSIFISTFSGNTASGTGGAISTRGSTQISRATIANNTAPSGGGLFVEGTDPTPATLMQNVLFSGNSTACGGFTSQRFPWSANLSDDTSCAFGPGEGTNGANALLGPLGNNGGPTDTHALSAGSPAINAGDPNSCFQGSTDQRHAPAPDACDIGSFEFGAVPPEPELPPPVAGETVNVSRARGIVKIKLPGSDEFFDLEDGQQVPVGSTFDTAKGRVNLRAAGSQQAWFYQGVFKLGQTRGRKPLSTLSLTGKLSCGGGKANAAAKRKKRRLWGDGKGKFRTKGEFSSATVRGTRWLVEDRCDGTLTRVTKGKVAVRDFVRKRTVIVRAGKQYLAKRRR